MKHRKILCFPNPFLFLCPYDNINIFDGALCGTNFVLFCNEDAAAMHICQPIGGALSKLPLNVVFVTASEIWLFGRLGFFADDGADCIEVPHTVSGSYVPSSCVQELFQTLVVFYPAEVFMHVYLMPVQAETNPDGNEFQTLAASTTHSSVEQLKLDGSQKRPDSKDCRWHQLFFAFSSTCVKNKQGQAFTVVCSVI